MKYVKILALVAVAAMALTASLGASTASAKKLVLCAKVASPLGDGKCNNKQEEILYGQVVKATSTEAVLTSSITNVTCHSDVSVTPSSSEGEPTISGEVTALTFTSCKTSSGTACTVQVVNLPYPGTLSSEQLTVNDSTGAGAKVVCGFLINCTFTTKHAVLAIDNGESSPSFTASKVKLERSGGFCPETAEWDATYSVVDPAGFTIETH